MSAAEDETGEFVHPCAKEKIHLLNLTQSVGIMVLVRLEVKRCVFEVQKCSMNTCDFGLPEASQLIGGSVLDMFDVSGDLYGLIEHGEIFPVSLKRSGEPFMVIARRHEQNTWILDMIPSKYDNNPLYSMNSVLRSVNAVMELRKHPEAMLHSVCEWIFERSGYDRIMLYKFDADFNGVVVHECCKDPSIPSFLGLRFPNSDIPSQARKLYMKNIIRQICDSDDEPVGVYPVLPVLDLSTTSLRSVSKVHLQYLKNMGVTSSMSLTISVNNSLYGMFVGHNYKAKKILGLSSLESFRVVGHFCSLRLASMLARSEAQVALKAERLLDFPSNTPVVDIWESSVERFMEDLDAQSAVLLHRKFDVDDFTNSRMFVYQKGKTVDTEVMLEVLRLLGLIKDTSVQPDLLNDKISISDQSSTASPCNIPATSFFAVENNDDLYMSNEVHKMFSQVTQRLDKEKAELIPAGMLYISCSIYDMIFFREEAVVDIKWAGKESMHSSISKKPLTPRNSFDMYVMRETGRSKPWDLHVLTIGKTIRTRVLQFMHGEVSLVQRDMALKVAKKKSEFLAHMSHELRTPFNGIIGMLDVLLTAEMGEEDKECVQAAYESSRHMLQILDDVLLVSKMNASKLALAHVPFDLNDLLKVMSNLLKFRASQTENQLVIKMHSLPVTQFVGDPGRIRQVLMNLLTNAMKYTSNGSITLDVNMFSYPNDLKKHIEDLFQLYKASSVSLSSLLNDISNLRFDKESKSLILCFQVSDNGQGIPVASIQSLFMAFQQVDSSSSRQYQGTGLGLYICKSLVELMGGHIFALSTHHIGSCFAFYVQLCFQTEIATQDLRKLAGVKRKTREIQASPKLKQPMPRKAPSDKLSTSTFDSISFMKKDPSVNPMFKSLQGHKVRKLSTPEALHSTVGPLFVIVDDNLMTHKILKKLLQNMERNAVFFESGGEAVSFYSANHKKVSTILIDLNMPGVDGWQTVAMIRAFEGRENLGRCKLICHTADILTSKKRFENAGFDDVLRKPITRGKLKELFQE